MINSSINTNISYRSIDLLINNGTDTSLQFVNIATFSGTEAVTSPLIILPNEVSNVHAEGAMLEEPSGEFAWKGTMGEFVFKYNHPVVEEPTIVTFESVPQTYEILTISSNLDQHSATASYQIKARGGE